MSSTTNATRKNRNAVTSLDLSRFIGGKYSTVLLALALCASSTWAQTTYTAASCNAADIQAKINQEQLTPVDGDIISIPAGTCTWTGTSVVSATFANSITIQGAGAISATTGGASTAGTDQTVIIDNINHGSGPATNIKITTTAGKSFRFTGIAVLTNGSSTATNNGVIALFGNSSSVRVDHCHFTAIATTLAANGSIQGVADHIFVEGLNNSSVTTPIFPQNGQGWNGASDPNGYGDGSWNDVEHWGSSKFFFIEDSRFHNGDLGDAHDGARYVLRYSTIVTDTVGHGQMFNHGMSNSPGNGTRAAEVYQNHFVQPGSPGAGNPAYSVNSGSLLFWGNTVTQYHSAVQIGYTCRPNSTGCNYSYPAPPTNWGYCGTTFNGTGSAWDFSAVTATGYPCLSQPGRGKGDLLNGQSFPNRLNTRTSTVAWPQQVLSPIYIWANTYTPSAGYSGSCAGLSCLTQVVGSGVSAIVSDNRDYYQDFGTYGETGSWNGTKGINQSSSAPSGNCTAGTDAATGGSAPGVGWWDTTNQTLYICNPTNTWIAYYTPYTYPHPLTQMQAAPAPPTGLTVTVQ